MKIAILSSSRADFGIYLPLLEYWREKTTFQLEIIAFGMHLQPRFGNTISEIESSGFTISDRVFIPTENDSPFDIATEYALTVQAFAEIWKKQQFDWVICLGDRFEMAAAVNAGIPFGVRFAHLHAGEKTEGAIDEIYRHQISLAAQLHFCSIPTYAEKVHQLIGKTNTTIVCGAISLLRLTSFKGLTKDEFYAKWKIDLKRPTLLVTVHPETINYQQNEAFAKEIKVALQEVITDFQILVTAPNSDTGGHFFRSVMEELAREFTDFHFVESLGAISYFSALQHCALVVGNTSSGIIEAASFEKYFINIGERQAGRSAGNNVIQVPFVADKIIQAIFEFAGKSFSDGNLYFQEDGLERITQHLLQHHTTTDYD